MKLTYQIVGHNAQFRGPFFTYDLESARSFKDRHGGKIEKLVDRWTHLEWVEVE